MKELLLMVLFISTGTLLAEIDAKSFLDISGTCNRSLDLSDLTQRTVDTSIYGITKNLSILPSSQNTRFPVAGQQY